MADKNNGPTVSVSMSCFDCAHCESKGYAVQGGSGIDVWCRHPQFGRRVVGDSRWNTPAWCPFRKAAIEAIIARLTEEVAQ